MFRVNFNSDNKAIIIILTPFIAIAFYKRHEIVYNYLITINWNTTHTGNFNWTSSLIKK